MKKFLTKSVSALAVTVMLGGLSLAHPAYAADDTAGVGQTQTGDVDQDSGVRMHHKGGIHRVDARIRALHDKLGVTSAQEAKFRAVARVMRENERDIHSLIVARNNMQNENAVADLKSYEKIAVAHEEGLKRLIPVFRNFYASLTPDQQSAADDIFSRYEGRRGEGMRNAARYNNNNFNNIQPSGGNDVNSGGTDNGNNNAPASGTDTTAAPDQPANQGETK